LEVAVVDLINEPVIAIVELILRTGKEDLSIGLTWLFGSTLRLFEIECYRVTYIEIGSAGFEDIAVTPW
jgi:hypothetical protein